MILCHRYKFIFLKTAKTAGSSIEIALARFCEKEDIISPCLPEEEDLYRQFGSLAPQNYWVPFGKYRLWDWAMFLGKGVKRQFRNHMHAHELKPLLKEEIWNTYFKFSFERNPWDKVISYYYWQHRDPSTRPSLSEFILSGQADRILGFQVYSLNGKVAVDRVGKYENLTQDFSDICRQIGLPEIPELPRAKGDQREDRRSYREILGSAEKERIEKVYYREINLLEYTF